MENHGGMILMGKTEELGGKPVPVPLCPPQIPRGFTWAKKTRVRFQRPATSHLSHDTAYIKEN
jgi:hypothetical protein